MTRPSRAVFLSYASQDGGAAQRISEALRDGGVEVWLDTTELRGGDAWDQKIRRQIRDCALFIPIISETTQSRAEGYFRREWRLAVERTADMSDRIAFLVPVVIDATTDREADVPEAFRNVQWTRLPEGNTPPEFAERVASLLGTVPERAVPARPIPPAHPAGAPQAGPPHTPPGRSGFRAILLAGCAAALLAAALVGWLHFRGAKPQPLAPAGTAAGAAVREQSVAVLPFVNMSSDKEQDYFSDGLSEELIDMLSKVPDLRVPARTSSFYFKGKNETIETMAEQLKVSNLLEGSVRKSGDRLRISAQLIRADNGSHLWSETYDREAKDIFKVQDEIAAAVVEALKLKLAPGRQAETSHRTSSTEAYDEFLLGQQLYNRGEISDLQHSIDAYRRAIALDPGYAGAYAGLAIAESTAADMQGDGAGLERARTAADKAVALAPNESGGYAARAFLRYDFDWDWPGALADTEKAIALNAGDSDAQRRYADLLMTLGRPAESIAAIKKALELDPLSARSWGDRANILIAAHDYDGAYKALVRALEINPDSPYVLNDLGLLQLLQGKFQEALESFKKTRFDPFLLPGTAMAQHSLGRDAESKRTLEEASVKVWKEGAYQLAEAYAWCGDKDRALEWLEHAYRQRDGGLVTVNADPLIAILRGDPRYEAFLRKMKLHE
jgi:TolB-like protein/Tfp pilus assembly protein PilF